MTIAEGTSARVARKAYTDSAITATEAVPGTDPGATGAQILRRTTFSVVKSRAGFSPNELNNSRQRKSFRLGPTAVAGSLVGDLSPGTYWVELQAALRATGSAAVIASDETDFTSVAASAGDGITGTFTLGGGAPVTDGYRVGDVIRFTGLSEAANNSKNFLIIGFSGTSNRVIAVYPAPAAIAVADTEFDVTTVGRSVFMPITGHTVWKLAYEAYNEDVDRAKLATECRLGGFKMRLGNAVSTIEFPIVGRNMVTYTGENAPFFTDATAETSTDVVAGVNGVFLVNGVVEGYVTGGEINAVANPTAAEPTIGRVVADEIFVDDLTLSGQLTVYVSEDTTLSDAFDAETEIAILFFLPNSSAVDGHAITVLLPAVKITSDNAPLSGKAGQIATMTFEATQYGGSTAGMEATTVRIVDTAAA